MTPLSWFAFPIIKGQVPFTIPGTGFALSILPHFPCHPFFRIATPPPQGRPFLFYHLFSLWSEVSWHNLHVVKLTLFKCTVQWVLTIANTHVAATPNRMWKVSFTDSSLTLSPAFSKISYKWSQIVFSLLHLTYFPGQNVFGIYSFWCFYQ